MVNEGSITEGDILIEDGRIVNIGSHLTPKDHLVAGHGRSRVMGHAWRDR